MKKILTGLGVLVLLVSCPGVGGEKIESTDTMFVLAQVAEDIRSTVTGRFSSDSVDKNEDGDFILDNRGSVGNFTLTSTTGVKNRDKAVYEATLVDWTFTGDYYLTEKAFYDNPDSGVLTSGRTEMTVTVSGDVAVTLKRANYNAVNSFYTESHRRFASGAKPLTVKIVNTTDNSTVYEGEVSVLINYSFIGNAYDDEVDWSAKINGGEYLFPATYTQNSGPVIDIGPEPAPEGEAQPAA